MSDSTESAMVDNPQLRRLAKQGLIAFKVTDAWGGYWQTIVDGSPYNFRLTASTNALEAENAKLKENITVAHRQIIEGKRTCARDTLAAALT